MSSKRISNFEIRTSNLPDTTAQFLSLIRQQQRGRLKVYFGYAPGVGKTCEMLREGQRLRHFGIDVVVGVIEPYGRADVVSLADGLEQVPCQCIPFRDLVWQQLDLDALLARRPTVVLVDELARANTPDSRHASRYQDIEELLSAGIHVLTTLNLQYLDGLQTSMAQVPGVKEKGRVPEHMVRMADQIVNVDPAADVLRERFASGRLYPSLQVGEELRSFFTLENLTGLRERAQQTVSELLDRRSRPRNSPEGRDGGKRFLVCLSSHSPNAARLLRKCSELADQLDAVWYAVHIHQENRTGRNPVRNEGLDGALALAKQLGGIPLTLMSSNLVGSITAFIAEYGITHIFIGRSRIPWYHRWFGRSVLDRLLHSIHGVDVTVVDNASKKDIS